MRHASSLGGAPALAAIPLLELQRIPAPDGSDDFGRASSLDGEKAIVGSEDAAYVFVRQGFAWTQQAVLAPSGVAVNFGESVALDGDTALIGARSDTAVGLGAGAAYVLALAIVLAASTRLRAPRNQRLTR